MKSDLILWSLLFLAGGCYAAITAYLGCKSGVLTIKGITARRNGQPILFWTHVSVSVLFAVLFSGAAAFIAYSGFHPN